MGMSEFYGPRDDETSVRVLHEAVELGVNFFDTADIYGPHHNEELIGGFLAECRETVKIATKCGIVRRPGEYKREINNSPDYIRAACEASLRRLGVERIDLYYIHRIEEGRDIEEAMGALSSLVQEGKIGHIGLCEVSAATLRRAHRVHKVSAVQSEYSLWAREAEDEVLPLCRELGAGFVPYSPLGRGFLTGNLETGEGDFRASLPRFQPEAAAVNQRIADVIRDAAQEKGCTAAQLCLAWLLAQGEHIVPVPGTKKSRWLRENVAAVDIALSAAEAETLSAALSALPVVGARYTPEGMKGVNL